MRHCPACQSPMVLRQMGRAHVDQCFHCGALYLDAGETDLTGVDSDDLFGRRARPVGASDRMCPCGVRPMTKFAIGTERGEVEVERSACCGGGVFLDHGEHELLQAALPAIDGASPSAQPEPVPSAPTRGRRCPRCGGAYQMQREAHLEIDTCPSCGSVFLDPGEVEQRGVDLSAVFGVGPEAARAVGPSELSCPVHAQPMVTYHVEHFAGLLEVERTQCCGGLYFDGGEYDLFVRAARQAKTKWADRKFATEGAVADPHALAEAVSKGADEAVIHTMRRATDQMILDRLRRRSRHQDWRDRRRGF